MNEWMNESYLYLRVALVYQILALLMILFFSINKCNTITAAANSADVEEAED